MRACVYRHTVGCEDCDMEVVEKLEKKLVDKLEDKCSQVHCDVCGAHACLDELNMEDKGDHFCMFVFKLFRFCLVGLYCNQVVCLSFIFWFLLLILLNNLSDGSHYLAGIANKHCLLALLV